MKSRKHIQRVAQLPCCVCGQEPVQVHHIIGRGLRGMSQKSSDYFAIPLCPFHHDNLHRNGWREWEQMHGSQVDHAARTLARIYG
jgi:hypothetical protein